MVKYKDFLVFFKYILKLIKFSRTFQDSPVFLSILKPVRTRSSAYFFSKSTFSENSFRNTIRVSNSLDPDQARQLSANDTSKNNKELSAE